MMRKDDTTDTTQHYRMNGAEWMYVPFSPTTLETYREKKRTPLTPYKDTNINTHRHVYMLIL